MRFVSLGMFDACSDPDIMRAHFEVGETAVTVVSDEEYIGVAEKAIFEAREIIQRKIADDPFFGTTYDPYPSSDEDELIERMCQASIIAGVGPMAGVAGAVAYHAVKRMKEAGAKFAIVENGGDIALLIDRDVTVGIFQNDERFRGLALSIPKREGIFGICSSSGKIGPSVSLGNTGISTVFSDDVILADACATALGNMIKEGSEEEMSYAVESIGRIDCVKGCLCISNGRMAMYGEVPQLVRSDGGGEASSIIF